MSGGLQVSGYFCLANCMLFPGTLTADPLITEPLLFSQLHVILARDDKNYQFGALTLITRNWAYVSRGS